MKTLFLVNCKIREEFRFHRDEYERNYIVEAEDEEGAISKVNKHYDNKEIEGVVTYYVNIEYCTEKI